MGNPNHDQRGRFASGSSGAAASGDHAAVSPSPHVRNVSGRTIPRSQTVTRHNGTPSLGTEKPRFVSTPGGLKPKQMTTGLRPAAAEKRALGFAGDARHYPDNKDVQRSLTKAVRGIGG